jgi:DNA-binding SARP family transcriptional activator
MEVFLDGRRLELPPSKKTRGLLAYLALTGRPHRRERLCSLLWDVADDPRGALRWSLSRLRAVVDEPECPRIRATRDSVAFDSKGARIDILDLKQRCAAGLADLPLGELTAFACEFRGELLEGLDLGDFADFEAWCVAEKEEARMLHGAVLRALVDRLAADPESALPHARALTAVDPLDESARVALVRLLAATGRRHEAAQQHEAASRLLQELGRPTSGELDAAWRGTREVAVAPREPESPAPPASPAGHHLVGREAERRRLVRALEEAQKGRRAQGLLLTGAPGLGKSSLLAELCAVASSRGATVIEGRAFEAESGRPFGPWIDAFRHLLRNVMAPALAADLCALLPDLALKDDAPGSRDRLFGAVVELLSERAASAPPVVLALDDVQWLDAASAELLHYVARMSRHRPLLVALTARPGELRDNEATQRALRSLTEMGILAEVPLAPLGPEETRELLRAAAPGVDVEAVLAESGGNPLFALELARSLPVREGSLPPSLTGLIRRRVERLPTEAGDLLRWASVLGHGFSASRLGELMALGLDRLLAALELLERHALLRARDGVGESRGGYEFAHELIGRAVYSDLSLPRRRLMHRRVAERLAQAEAPEAVASELAHHAALAGDSAVAARACVRAGRLYLRQFANAEAWAVARRGRRHAAEVPEPERVSLLLELLQVELQARRPQDVGAAAAELEALAQRALDHGAAEHARLGFHMLAYLRWEEGDLADAQRHMMRAELVGRAGDEQAQVVAMAETALCLALLERDLPRAEALALEANARAFRIGLRPSAIADAQGLLRQHQGRLHEAAELFEQARLEARRAGDAMGGFHALEHLVVLRQHQGDSTGARRLAIELEALGVKLREGSEAPFARALLALSRHALGEAGADAALDAAISELRAADAKLRLAYTLTRAARLDLARGDARRARTRAEEALHAATALGRPSELLRAGVTLVCACHELGEEAAAEAMLGELRRASLEGAEESARRELEDLVRGRGDGQVARAGVPSRGEGRP